MRTYADLRSQLFKNLKTIFSIVNEPPSWSDADDSLESMSDPEEDEDDIPEDKDSTYSGEGKADGDGEGEGGGEGEGEADVVKVDMVVADVDQDGDGDGETCSEDEDEYSSDNFFDAGEGTVIGPDRFPSRAAPES